MKTIDDKIEELGFVKVEESEYGAVYERYNPQYKYTHVVHIIHKSSGRHIIQSYDKESCSTEGILGGLGVGLTYSEMKLFTKKMKRLTKRWNKDWKGGKQ